jgi:hypothetical protein
MLDGASASVNASFGSEDAMQEQNPRDRQQPEVEKRPYVRPEIVDYGSVRDLTRGTGTAVTFDMHSGTRRIA